MMSLFDLQEIEKEVQAIKAHNSSSLVRNLVHTSIFYYSNIVHIENYVVLLIMQKK